MKFSFTLFLAVLFFPALALAAVFDPSVSVDSTAVILGALLAVSEALALVPKLKSNSVLQLAVNVLRWLVKKD